MYVFLYRVFSDQDQYSPIRVMSGKSQNIAEFQPPAGNGQIRSSIVDLGEYFLSVLLSLACVRELKMTQELPVQSLTPALMLRHGQAFHLRFVSAFISAFMTGHGACPAALVELPDFLPWVPPLYSSFLRSSSC